MSPVPNIYYTTTNGEYSSTDSELTHRRSCKECKCNQTGRSQCHLDYDSSSSSSSNLSDSSEYFSSDSDDYWSDSSSNTVAVIPMTQLLARAPRGLLVNGQKPSPRQSQRQKPKRKPRPRKGSSSGARLSPNPVIRAKGRNIPLAMDRARAIIGRILMLQPS